MSFTIFEYDIFTDFVYRKVARSRSVYYLIFEQNWCATNQDVLVTQGYYFFEQFWDATNWDVLLTESYYIIDKVLECY